MPRYMMWAVGENHDEYDFSALAPEQVASKAAAMLTDLSYLDGERLYSLGVRALDEAATCLADEPADTLATQNYMQTQGSAEVMAIEVRVATPQRTTHYVLASRPAPRRRPRFPVSLPYDDAVDFTGEEAAEVFRHYILTGQPPSCYYLNDLFLT